MHSSALRRSAFRPFIGAAAALALVCALPGAATATTGRIDPTFGILSNGTVLADHGRLDFVVKLLHQTDGKLVAVETGLGGVVGPYEMIATRYLANGRPDPSFGSGGTFLANLPLGGGAITDAALQPDGKVVLVGWGGPHTGIIVTRLRANGTVDPTFHLAQTPTTFPGANVTQAFGVAVGPGGTIVVAGRADANLALARFTSTGALDPTFSGDGRATHSFGGQSEAADVTVLPGGKIVVSGREDVTAGPHAVVARFNANGTIDATFGVAGRVNPATTPIGAVSTLLVQGTKLVITGRVDDSTGALTRFNANGTIDPTFGSAGSTRTNVGLSGFLSDVITDGAGRLVAIGHAVFSTDGSGEPSFVAVYRYSANGVRDSTFNCGGKIVTEVLGNGLGTADIAAGAVSGVSIGNDVVVGGFAVSSNPSQTETDALLARFDGDASSSAGYALLRGDGGTSSFGGAPACGSVAGIPLNRPIVGTAFDPAAPGNWSVASDGGVFSFGAATFHGSMGGRHLNQPIVGIAATPDGNGYWMVARDGGIFSFGSARFYGSTGAIRLNQPIVGMAATHDGHGYWLVAGDGGIFSFGTARFSGSTGAFHITSPVVGMAADPDGLGYW
ncbi:MAG TPA: hypothetical protein VGP92_19835, partial [Acidimicrobiia bacterium]|nr:hypothetical protein [Acidimicrobiia bacterium]